MMLVWGPHFENRCSSGLRHVGRSSLRPQLSFLETTPSLLSLGLRLHLYFRSVSQKELPLEPNGTWYSNPTSWLCGPGQVT